MDETLVAEIDNNLADIAKVTSGLEDFGRRHGVPEAIVFQIILAFDELLTNIISYGFHDATPHKITASIVLAGDIFQAEIIDDGIAFDPLARPDPDLDAPIEERVIGGLGIHFVKTVMDTVDYYRSDDRNHLKMWKKLPVTPAH